MTKKKQFCPAGHDAFEGGRDLSGRCLICKAEDAAAKIAAREQAIAEYHAAIERRQAEADRLREREYQAAIKAGGRVAAEARWERADEETLKKTGSRYGLCQWEEEVAGEFIGRECYRRTNDVYCHVHTRRLELEQAKEATR